MAVENRFESYTIQASADMEDQTRGTGHVYKAVSLDDGDISANGLEAGGILQSGVKSGEHATLAYFGITKYTAGAAVAAAARLTVTTSGYMITATSGSYVVGRNGDEAVGSGSNGKGLLNFFTPYYMTS